MKELIIVRHAKSNWGDASVDDHDRTLNHRGERDAPRMAALLADKLGNEGRNVDLLISSSAQRARSTAFAFAKALGVSEEDIDILQSGYLASAQEWMRIVAASDESAERVMIFGHNPGLEVLVHSLLGGDDSIGALPTCAVVRIHLNCEFWGSIDESEGRLIESFIPREALD